MNCFNRKTAFNENEKKGLNWVYVSNRNPKYVLKLSFFKRFTIFGEFPSNSYHDVFNFN